jgi:hypothetical protein
MGTGADRRTTGWTDLFAGKMRRTGGPRGLQRDSNDWEIYSDSPDQSDNNDE